jgi:Universal stress protein family
MVIKIDLVLVATVILMLGQTSSDIPKIQYNGISVPHDGTEKSDKALDHVIYLSKLSGAEIIILNVIEHVKDTDSSALSNFKRAARKLR